MTDISTSNPDHPGARPGARITETFDPKDLINPELLDDLEEDREGVSAEDMLEMIQLYEGTLAEIKEGQIVKGEVVEVRDNEILVDVGFKSEGTIPLDQFRDVDQIRVGDTYDVYLENIEDQDGLIALSKEKADFLKVWEDIKFSFDHGRIVHGVVDRRIKGGLVVNLMGRRQLPARFAGRPAPGAGSRRAARRNLRIPHHQDQQAPPQHRGEPPRGPGGRA